jgi:hypothetical protein
MIRRFIWIAAFIGIVMPGINLPCFAAQEAIEQFKTGSVNWTRGKIKASGLSGSQKNNIKKPLNCEKALGDAKIKAHHNLLDAAKAVRVENDVTIGEIAGQNDVIMARLMDMVKQAPVIEQKYLTDGTAEVTVEMSLLGGFSQLVLPLEIEHVESITPVGSNHKNHRPTPNTTESQPNPKKKIYSGLIVDARGLNINQVMTPKILDENRQEVYGPAFVSRELAVQKGLCHYETDITVAQNHEKVANNPFTVNGLRFDTPLKTYIFIIYTDALKIKSAS